MRPYVLSLLTLALTVPVWGWTGPVEISAPSSNERSTPRIARGGFGRLHVVYLNKASSWTIYYRSKSSAGNWGPVEQVSTAFAVRPDVAEDSTGRPHVIFAQTNTGGAYDLYHAYKNGGTWTAAYITTTNEYEDEPRLVPDTSGRMHLIYTKGSVQSSSGNVIYRVWNNGSWSGETILGSVNDAYYHRPDITIDSLGNLHAVWIQDSGGSYHIRYCKNTVGVWGAVIDAGAGSDSTHFFNYARVAVASPTNVCVVWHDDASAAPTSVIKWNYSMNGGASFAFGLAGGDQGPTLYPGHYPQLDSGISGAVHLISNQEPSESVLVYSKWTGGSTWAVNQEVVHSDSDWDGWPDITEDTGGGLHVVWDEPYGPNTSDHLIDYATTVNDVVPPAPVTNFVVTALHNRVHLTWTNPPDPDFASTVIRFSTSGFPATPASGTLLADRPASPGSNDSFDHTGVTNGIVYYYTAFARDQSNLYSSGVSGSGRPSVPMDRDLDGDVDQGDYGQFQKCMGIVTANCQWADDDLDGNIGPIDLAAFLNCLSGADTLYPSNCAG